MAARRSGTSRWSKLQRRLYDVLAPGADIQVHCCLYRMNSTHGRTDLPRYWITLGDEIIWDYPRHFVKTPHPGRTPPHWYPYDTDVGAISDLIAEYLNTPREELLDKRFENDHWGLINILRAADRRFGKRQFPTLRRKISNAAARKVLARRAAEIIAPLLTSGMPHT